jgi:DNA modification methylase
VFSPPENQWVFPGIDEYLFWVKPISTKNTSRRYSRFVEMMFVYQQEEAIWNSNRHWSQYINVFMDLVDDSKLHPYRKPLSLIKRLILNHTKDDDIIFDPFSGSGSVLSVCKETNRMFFGIEINKEYINE